MIAQLKGRIDAIADDWVIVDVQGVGYQVYCSTRVLAQMRVGQAVVLAIETQVREDAITLYGFPNQAEKAFFRLLVTVQGVGARVALALLSVAQPTQLSHAIAAQDKAVFTQAPGVGPKLAGRILSELKDKVASLSVPLTAALPQGGEAIDIAPDLTEASPTSAPSAAPVDTADTTDTGPDVTDDAVSALVNLGYGRSDAYAAVARVISGSASALSVQQAIGLALKDLGKGL